MDTRRPLRCRGNRCSYSPRSDAGHAESLRFAETTPTQSSCSGHDAPHGVVRHAAVEMPSALEKVQTGAPILELGSSAPYFFGSRNPPLSVILADNGVICPVGDSSRYERSVVSARCRLEEECGTSIPHSHSAATKKLDLVCGARESTDKPCWIQ